MIYQALAECDGEQAEVLDQGVAAEKIRFSAVLMVVALIWRGNLFEETWSKSKKDPPRAFEECHQAECDLG